MLGDQQERLIDALLTLATSERGIERSTDRPRRDRPDRHRRPRQLADSRGSQSTHHWLPRPRRPLLVELLVANLIDNALRHNIAVGNVTCARPPPDGRPDGRQHGPAGPEAPSHLFEPSGPPARPVRHGDGHGLGLAIVHAVADAHGATINAMPAQTAASRSPSRFRRPDPNRARILGLVLANLTRALDPQPAGAIARSACDHPGAGRGIRSVGGQAGGDVGHRLQLTPEAPGNNPSAGTPWLRSALRVTALWRSHGASASATPRSARCAAASFTSRPPVDAPRRQATVPAGGKTQIAGIT